MLKEQHLRKESQGSTLGMQNGPKDGHGCSHGYTVLCGIRVMGGQDLVKVLILTREICEKRLSFSMREY